jgi:hypothetical protein
MLTPALFNNIPEQDPLGFGLGPQFQPRRVIEWLGLRMTDVSRVANVPPHSVRYEDEMPVVMRDRLEEIAMTCNLVAQAFDGDVVKTAMWFKARNPLLGDVSPRDMVRLGRFDRLLKFIANAMSERAALRAAAERLGAEANNHPNRGRT